MINKLFSKIKAERINPEDSSLAPFFFQQLRAYQFCDKYIRGKRILEIGSGSGYGSYLLSKKAKEIIAIDKDSLSIQESKNKYGKSNLKFKCITIEDFKQKKKFEVIILLQVIEHLRDVNILLKKITSLLEKDGTLILSTPNALTQSYNENPYHYKEFNPEELLELLKPYFKKTILYGVFGDSLINKYEIQRKKQVLSLLKIDKYNLRRLIPRSIKQIIFDSMSYLRKSNSKKAAIKFNENNFSISQKNLNKSIDIIAICKA